MLAEMLRDPVDFHEPGLTHLVACIRQTNQLVKI
jgi:hypothetical protein